MKWGSGWPRGPRRTSLLVVGRPRVLLNKSETFLTWATTGMFVLLGPRGAGPRHFTTGKSLYWSNTKWRGDSLGYPKPNFWSKMILGEHFSKIWIPKNFGSSRSKIFGRKNLFGKCRPKIFFGSSNGAWFPEDMPIAGCVKTVP